MEISPPMIVRPIISHRSSCAIRTHRRGSSASCDSGEQRVLRFFKRLNRHVACDGGELAQEFVEWVAAFEVVDEVLEGDARTSEAGNAVEDLLAGNDDGLAHACRIAVEARVGMQRRVGREGMDEKREYSEKGVSQDG